jgi:glycosyltransferase involved in cell wall biosynthesis
MGTLLTKLYGISDDNIKVVSNLAFFEAKQHEYIGDDAKQIRIGHLANLCIDKGVDIFIDVCRTLCDKKIKFTAVVAGPCVDEITKKLVLDAVEEIPQLKYVGPLYDEQKKLFYQSLDCFIFPSKYKNEAEPLVLYEAALNGSFLVGTKRGCMEEVIGKLAGFSSAEHSCIANEITNVILFEQENRGFDLQNKAKRLDLFQHEQIKAKESLLSFIKDMDFHELSKARQI